MTATSGPLRGLPDLDTVNASAVLAYQRHWLRHYRQRYIEGMPL